MTGTASGTTPSPRPAHPVERVVHFQRLTPAAARPARRADAGTVRLSQRDIDGLLLCGEHYGAPADLLAAALLVEEARLPAITARWRRAGYAATGRLGPGWWWLTRDGMTATGLVKARLRITIDTVIITVSILRYGRALDDPAA